MLWRAKTNIFRNKKGTLWALWITFSMMLLAVGLKFLLGKYELNIESQNYVTITSSGNLTNGTNFFVDPTQPQKLKLPNCKSQNTGGSTIAYV